MPSARRYHDTDPPHLSSSVFLPESIVPTFDGRHWVGKNEVVDSETSQMALAAHVSSPYACHDDIGWRADCSQVVSKRLEASEKATC